MGWDMSSELRDAVSKWLYALPGTFEGKTDDETIVKALEDFGLGAPTSALTQISFEAFKEVLHSCGRRPEWRSKGRWVLALPERGPGTYRR